MQDTTTSSKEVLLTTKWRSIGKYNRRQWDFNLSQLSFVYWRFNWYIAHTKYFANSLTKLIIIKQPLLPNDDYLSIACDAMLNGGKKNKKPQMYIKELVV